MLKAVQTDRQWRARWTGPQQEEQCVESGSDRKIMKSLMNWPLAGRAVCWKRFRQKDNEEPDELAASGKSGQEAACFALATQPSLHCLARAVCGSGQRHENTMITTEVAGMRYSRQILGCGNFMTGRFKQNFNYQNTPRFKRTLNLTGHTKHAQIYIISHSKAGY